MPRNKKLLAEAIDIINGIPPAFHHIKRPYAGTTLTRFNIWYRPAVIAFQFIRRKRRPVIDGVVIKIEDKEKSDLAFKLLDINREDYQQLADLVASDNKIRRRLVSFVSPQLDTAIRHIAVSKNSSTSDIVSSAISQFLASSPEGIAALNWANDNTPIPDQETLQRFLDNANAAS